MNQAHEAIRWLHAEKGMKAHEIARQMKLETELVHRVLRSLGFKTKTAPRPVTEPSAPKPIIPIALDRSPCFKCGTRADVGCKHTRRVA